MHVGTVSALGSKEQNKQEVAWQRKTLPRVNFEDEGKLVEENKKRDKKGKQEGKKAVAKH